MKRAGVTGSTCLRSVPRVRRWMRCRMRRSHHSSAWGSVVGGCSKMPRRARPCISIVSRDWWMAEGAKCVRVARWVEVVGPRSWR